jgi:hypothetical protein
VSEGHARPVRIWIPDLDSINFRADGDNMAR